MNRIIRVGVGYELCPDVEELAERLHQAGEIAKAIEGKRYEAGLWPIPQTGLPEARQIGGIDVLFPGVLPDVPSIRRMSALAEAAGLPCVGYSLPSAVLGPDRVLKRRLLSQAGIGQPLFRSFSRSQWRKDKMFHLIEMELTLGYPCLIRPATGTGFAVRSAYIYNREELEESVNRLMELHDTVLAEEQVEGRVLVAALLGGALPEVAGVGEWWGTDTDGSALTVEAAAKVSGVQAPSPLTTSLDAASEQELVKSLRKASLKASAALSVSGPALLYYVAPNCQQPLLLIEAELLPDLGPRGVYASLWSHNGHSYPELARLLIERSLLRPV